MQPLLPAHFGLSLLHLSDRRACRIAAKGSEPDSTTFGVWFQIFKLLARRTLPHNDWRDRIHLNNDWGSGFFQEIHEWLAFLAEIHN
jgi:hypothetical protein